MNILQAQIAQEAAALVNRANAGDQNAMAMIRRIGEEARAGRSQRALVAAAYVEGYAKRASSQPFQLCPTPPQWKRVTTGAKKTRAVFSGIMNEPDKGKKPLPKGALEGVTSKDGMVKSIVKAFKFRYGANAAALKLSKGPVLSQESILEIGSSCFGSDSGSEIFLYAVKNPDGCGVLAPNLDAPGKGALAVGQVVGKALRLQAIRGEGCPISAYDAVIGWELGEDV